MNQKLLFSCLILFMWIKSSSCGSSYRSKTSYRGLRQADIDTCDGRSEFRLTRSVVPEHYDLMLKPNLELLNFEGEVRIKLKLLEKVTKKISLHSVDLNLTDVSFTPFTNSPEDVENPVDKIEFSEKMQTATFTFQKAIETSSGYLKIKFKGTLNDLLKGFYRSSYKSENGTKKYAAVTQFEPTDARRCFPSFDEPDLKSTFSVTLVVDDSLTALSNGREESVTVYEKDSENYGKKMIKYEKSPKMSTYLLAVVIGEYDMIQGTTDSGTLVRVFTPKGKSSQGKFALDVGIKSLNLFEKYFDIKFPMAKCDQVSIADFAAGAMENWGLVTYRETALLIHPNDSSVGQKQQVALTVAHELAHQWFGNLVTMKWWTDLWLNEGFASFMMYKAVDEMFPEWKLWQKFTTDMYSTAQNLDALDNSHAIEVPIDDPNTIHEVFDVISYRKGSSVLRMLHDWIGDANFRKGLQIYLNRFKYQNTCTRDLWSALEDASSLPVARVMSTWTKQKGFPLLTVNENQRTDSESFLTLSQKKFSADSVLSSSDRLVQWEIPIKYSTPEMPEVTDSIMSEKFRSIAVAISSRDDWIKMNTKSIGFYRSQYSEELLEKFIPGIINKNLTEVDRLQLQSDLFALIKAGYESTPKFLDFILNSYKSEDDYFVWDSIDDSLGFLNALLSNTDYQEMLHEFGITLYEPLYQKIKWDADENESTTESLKRSLVLGRLGSFGHEGVAQEARKRFNDHLAGISSVHPDLRSVVYRTVARNMSDEDFQKLLELYKKAETSSERNRIGSAMGSTKKENQIKQVLDFSLTSSVRSQDAPSVITSVTGSLLGRKMAWKFFQDNYDELSRRYANDLLISRLIKGITSNFATEDMAVEVEKFFKKRQEELGSQRAVQQSVENIRVLSKWLERDGEKIKGFFEKNSKKDDIMTT